jgi:ribonuclease HII
MSSKPSPTIEFERSIADRRYLIGIDEVGRGAIAGPVAVGAFVVDVSHLTESAIPPKLKDSKLMTEKARNEVFLELEARTPGYAVGYVDAKTIDQQGIVWSLANAAVDALKQLAELEEIKTAIAENQVSILLDGTHNWLESVVSRIPITVRRKADRDCFSVSAAAVLAKVSRDRLMVELAESYPQFGLDGHKGYASAAHIAAIREHGPSEIHRVSWLTRILEA